VLLWVTDVVKDDLGRVRAGDHGDDRQAVVGFDAVGHEDAARRATARHRAQVDLVLGRVAGRGDVDRAREWLPLLDGQRHQEGEIVDRQFEPRGGVGNAGGEGDGRAVVVAEQTAMVPTAASANKSRSITRRR
jgi:hypothetical protein